MKPHELIESGLLELYVMGQTSDEENVLVSQMAKAYPEIDSEIQRISDTLETWAKQNAIEPDPTLKPFLMATLRYLARLEKGEMPVLAPELSNKSSKEDFSRWLDREDLQLEEPEQDFYAHFITATKKGMTAIVWIKRFTPPEEHDNEYERFLVLEGSCEINIDGVIHYLYPGDFMQIPLYKTHHVKVTSPKACKVILQRLAA